MLWFAAALVGLLPLLASAASSSGNSSQGFFTGNSLIEVCEDARIGAKGTCAGYILGAFDAQQSDQDQLQAIGIKPRFCIPQGLAIGEVERVATRYLEENPSQLHFSATSLVRSAMVQAFPCQ